MADASHGAKWLTIVIPTIGRDSLMNTLDALDAQPAELLDGVEILVVGDTYGGMTMQLAGVADHLSRRAVRTGHPYQFVEHDGGVHVFGQPQRNAGARAASGEYVWFGQDDNVAARGALEAIYKATRGPLSPLLFFRWIAPWREIIWRYPTIELGNLDADCIVMRRDLAASVEWGLRYEGDFDVARAAFAATEQLEPDWQTSIVSIARPTQEYRWWL